jgi:hypothetical protein
MNVNYYHKNPTLILLRRRSDGDCWLTILHNYNRDTRVEGMPAASGCCRLIV